VQEVADAATSAEDAASPATAEELAEAIQCELADDDGE
jgi:hypothetical protein